MLVIPVPTRLEAYSEFKASLGSVVRSCLTKDGRGVGLDGGESKYKCNV